MHKIIAISGVVIKELYRRKDFYVLFVLTALITLLMGSANFFGDASLVGYITEIALLLIWISLLVISISTAARQIPSERENRTILPLLAKPVTRGQLIMGKFIGSWLAATIAMLVFYLFLALIIWSRGEGPKISTYIQGIWLHWVCLAIITAMAICGSVFFSAPSANITITLIVTSAILTVGRYLNLLAEQKPEPFQSIIYAIYYAIPHLEWYDLRDLIVHKHPPAPWWAAGVVTLYGTVYSAIFLTITWLRFKRTPLINA